MTLGFFVALLAVYYAYRKKHVNTGLLWLHRLSLRIVLPLISFLAGIISYSKDDVRKFYVDVNNILVRSGGKKYAPGEVLILLPHCLQHSECTYKITNDIRNCRKCGRCCIGGILEIMEETGVKAAVATGGTLARRIVAESKPGLIVSVACERDLTSGISDVNCIPVVGLINERPFGPCHNTTVNIESFRKRLYEVLDLQGRS